MFTHKVNSPGPQQNAPRAPTAATPGQMVRDSFATGLTVRPQSPPATLGPAAPAAVGELYRRRLQGLLDKLVGFDKKPLRDAVALSCGHLCSRWEAEQRHRFMQAFEHRAQKTPARAAQLLQSAASSYQCACCTAPIDVAPKQLASVSSINHFLTELHRTFPRGVEGAGEAAIKKFLLGHSVAAMLRAINSLVPIAAGLMPVLPSTLQSHEPPQALLCPLTGRLFAEPMLCRDGRVVDESAFAQAPELREGALPCDLFEELVACYQAHRRSTPGVLRLRLAELLICPHSKGPFFRPATDSSGTTVDYVALEMSRLEMQLLRPEGSFGDADWPIHNQTVRTLVEHLRSDPAVAEFWVQQLPAAVDLDAPLLATLTAEERLDYEAGLQGNLCDLLKAEHAAEHTAVLTAGELYLDARPSGEYAPMAAFLCSHAHTQRNNFAEAEQMAAHGVALAAQRPPQDNIVNLLRGIHINALHQQGYGASVRQTLYAYAEHNVQAPVSAGIEALYNAATTSVLNPSDFNGPQSNFEMCEALLQLNPSLQHHRLMMAAALRFLKGKRARLEGKILLDTFHLSPEDRKSIAEMRTHALMLRGLKWLIPRETMLNAASAAANES